MLTLTSVMRNIFISGISSGIGLELAKYYLRQDTVYGISRRPCPISDSNLNHSILDMKKYDSYDKTLKPLFKNVSRFDLIILNAGILGEISSLQEANLDKMKEVMEVNLWSQKSIIDFFINNYKVKQVIAISSGVVNDENKGWSSYLISKVALNSLIKLYAIEKPDTHFLSLAPGLVETPMLKSLLSLPEKELPSLKYIKNNGSVLTPEQLAIKFDKLLPLTLKAKSGDFIDINQHVIS